MLSHILSKKNPYKDKETRELFERMEIDSRFHDLVYTFIDDIEKSLVTFGDKIKHSATIDISGYLDKDTNDWVYGFKHQDVVNHVKTLNRLIQNDPNVKSSTILGMQFVHHRTMIFPIEIEFRVDLSDSFMIEMIDDDIGASVQHIETGLYIDAKLYPTYQQNVDFAIDAITKVLDGH